MNSLIIFPEELKSPVEAVLTGERTLHAVDEHELTVGLTIRAALFGGNRGSATVLECSSKEVRLAVQFTEVPLPRCNQTWIVALSRPQTIKKIVQAAATLGIQALHIVRAAQSVKSYAQSPVLTQEGLRAEVLKGLEQSGDSVAPEISVHALFRPFIEDCLPGLLNDLRNPLCFLAHTRSISSLCGPVQGDQNCVLAIGPESGWSEHEAEQFGLLGFRVISLGARCMRVDTAAIYLSGQLECLREGGRN